MLQQGGRRGPVWLPDTPGVSAGHDEHGCKEEPGVAVEGEGEGDPTVAALGDDDECHSPLIKLHDVLMCMQFEAGGAASNCETCEATHMTCMQPTFHE